MGLGQQIPATAGHGLERPYQKEWGERKRGYRVRNLSVAESCWGGSKPLIYHG